MSTQPVTVESDGYNITSNHATADEMIASLKTETKTDEPREVKPEGDEPEKSPLSKAASELGKKGGEAAAAKRAEAKKAKEADDDTETSTSEDEPKPKEAKADDSETEKPTGKPRDDAKARMFQATQQLKAERAERERVASELAQARAELERLRQGKPEPERARNEHVQAQDDDDPAPKEEDFSDYAEFTRAAARHEARQEWKRLDQERTIKEKSERYAKTYTEQAVGYVDTFRGRIDAAEKAEPGFIESIDQRLLQIQPSFMMPAGQRPGPLNVWAEEVMGSEHVGALLRHFTNNPEEMGRIASLPNPQAIAREIGRLEMRFDKPATEAPRQSVSKAKPPIKPVAATSHSTADEPDDDSDFDSHASYYNARDQKKRR